MKIKHVKRQFQKREYHVKFTRRIFMTPPSTKFRYTLYSICTALRNSGVGDGGSKRTPKCWFVEKSGKISDNLGKISKKSGQNP